MNEKEIFKSFIEKNEVLIVDKSSTSRNRLFKILAELGFKRNLIHQTDNIKEGLEIAQTKKVGLVLSEFLIGGGSGFDMYRILRLNKSLNPKMCFILVTANIAQASVARAAEEDVDSYVIKPYTLQSIKENLVKTISEKIKPSRYLLKIEEGKSYIEAKNYEMAVKALQTATKMHKEPSLALFYLGQAEYLMNEKDNAEESFGLGLKINDIHFKCLDGLYNLMMECEEFDKAYLVLKQITLSFPANPERLKQVIHLAVRTNQFPDMNTYYDQFISMESRDEKVVRYVGAGLYVAGKYHLRSKDNGSALKCFDALIISCAELTHILKSCVDALVEFGLADDAENVLRRFPKDKKSSLDYLLSDFMVSSKKIADKNALIKMALVLYNQNVRDKKFLSVMVKIMEDLNYNSDRIAPYKEALLNSV